MAQTFFPITPVEVGPAAGQGGAWRLIDVSAHIPAGATGVVLHLRNNSASYAIALGLRKNGSTDNRIQSLQENHHCWAMIGVDANRIFQCQVGSIAGDSVYIDVYLIGYTIAGVTFTTNATDKAPGVTGSWQVVDCSALAPGAIGLIFEFQNTAGDTFYNWGIKMNGSGDARLSPSRTHNGFGVVIGCDATQKVQIYIANAAVHLWLVGYITDGAVFYLNATDKSLAATGAWTDLAALPADAVMGFIEVITTEGYFYGLRKNGSAENIYGEVGSHPWGIVECDASKLIEGKIYATYIDFFLVGYATSDGAPPAAMPWNIGAIVPTVN